MWAQDEEPLLVVGLCPHAMWLPRPHWSLYLLCPLGRGLLTHSHPVLSLPPRLSRGRPPTGQALLLKSTVVPTPLTHPAGTPDGSCSCPDSPESLSSQPSTCSLGLLGEHLGEASMEKFKSA